MLNTSQYKQTPSLSFKCSHSIQRPIGGAGRVFQCFTASRSLRLSSDFPEHSGHQQRHMPQLLMRICLFPQNGHGNKIPCRVHSSCACRSPSRARRSRSVTLFTAFSRNQRIKQGRAFSAYHMTWCKNLPTTLANRLWWLTHGSCPLSNLIYHVVCQLFCSLVKRRFACFCDLIQLLRIYSSAYNSLQPLDGRCPL